MHKNNSNTFYSSNFTGASLNFTGASLNKGHDFASLNKNHL